MRHFRIAHAVFLITVLSTASEAFAGNLVVDGTLVSTVPSGTPPLAVTSTSPVANLNADMVDGLDAADFATGSDLATAGSGVTVHWENLVGVPDDGVLEINQACASASCFPGDLPGFPVSIWESGSYRLTSNLDLTSEVTSRDAIDILASNVTIDLNGFTILGPTTCSGSPLLCSPAGTGTGVNSESSPRAITIRNGIIQGMPGPGVSCGGGCRVEGVSATENGGNGITVRNVAGFVRGCQALRNGGEGIRLQGIARDNVAEENGTVGIFSQPGSTLIGNTVLNNGGNGIRCFSCLMLDNTIFSNDGFGVELGGGAAYGRNMIYDNDDGARAGSGLEVDVNLCATGSACS